MTDNEEKNPQLMIPTEIQRGDILDDVETQRVDTRIQEQTNKGTLSETGINSQTPAQIRMTSYQMHSWIKRYPNTGIGPALGLAGNSILWNTMSVVPFTSWVGINMNWFTWIGGAVCLTLHLLIVSAKMLNKDYRVLVMMEWNHPVRCYFHVAPLVAVLMLNLGCPNSIWNQTAGRISCLVCQVLQIWFTMIFYGRWMYSKNAHLGKAAAPYLLSVVGWFLVTVLCQKTKIVEMVGINLAALNFGVGCVFEVVSMIAIFDGFHKGNTGEGHPAHFLLIAPPAVMTVCVAGFRGQYDDVSQGILGFCLIMFIILVKLGMTIFNPPAVFGVYWAYVFPMSAMATGGVKMAQFQATKSSEVFAWILVAISVITLLLVFLRMSAHHVQVVRGKEIWGDALFDVYLKNQAAKQAQQDGPQVNTNDVLIIKDL